MSSSKKDKAKKGKEDQKSNDNKAEDDKKKEGPTAGTNPQTGSDGASDPLAEVKISKHDESRPLATTEAPPVSVQVNINPLWWALCFLSFATRLWRLDEPSQVVFDEVHFGKFVSYYMHRTFFFDVHPPLGKQLLSLMAWFTNYEGYFPFQNIGEEYDRSLVAYGYLRLVPAVCGSAVPLMVYRIVTELGYSHYTAALSALLLIFDNASITQCRFILIDSILIFFIVLSVLCYVVFTNDRDHFSASWTRKLAFTGVFLGCALSVKFVGVFVVLLIGLHTLRDLWVLLGQKKLSDNSDIVHHLIARAIWLILIPTLVFSACFYIEFWVLYRSGPHDAFMSRDFQASLEGSRILTHPEEMPQIGVEYQVAYGSHVSLKRINGESCWLHSHPHNYPVFYEDKRGSSAQQQVTCYGYQDLNNWWIIQRPGTEQVKLDDPPVAVKDNDLVTLVHRGTNRKLNSHNVAAPMTPTNQEVSCYVHYENISVLQDLWRVKFINPREKSKNWTSTSTRIQLIHVNSSQALRSTDIRLPEWGFYQFEVTTNAESPKVGSEWVVEEIQYGINPQNRTEDSEDLTAPVQMWFIRKLVEMVTTMLVKNQELTEEHAFSSRPSEWVLSERCIAYWISNTTMAQIQLLGNPFLWWTSSFCVVVYLGLLGFYLVRRKRQIEDLQTGIWTQFKDIGYLLLGGWIIHYLPFFTMDRALFLHHYLPAAVFQITLTSVVIDHVYHHVIPSDVRVRKLFLGLVGLLVLAIVWSFYFFSPLSYGLKSLTPETIAARRWLSTWDLLVRRPDGQIGMLI